MLRVASFLWHETDSTTGLLTPPPDGTDETYGLVDWPPLMRYGYYTNTRIRTTSAILGADAFARAAQIARILGDDRDARTWRAGWAFLHLGRAYEQAGRDDEASLAYRGCLAAEGAERPAKKLAFDLMSRLAADLPMGYGQAAARPVEKQR